MIVPATNDVRGDEGRFETRSKVRSVLRSSYFVYERYEEAGGETGVYEDSRRIDLMLRSFEDVDLLILRSR